MNDCETCKWFGPEEDPICNWFACDGLECDECNYISKEREKMSEWNVDVREELGEERVQAICENELKDALHYYFRNEANMTRIISNAVYRMCFEFIKEQWDGDLEQLTRDKVEENIVNMPSYVVVNNSSYSGKTEAYKIIEEESKAARPLIKEMVEKHIREYSFHELERDEIGDVIWEVIMNKILKPREENESVED